MSEMMTPLTGLIGSEQALQGGSSAALNALLGGFNQAQGILSGPGAGYNMGGIQGSIQQGVQGVQGSIGQGVQALNPFAQQGGQAMNLQAALAGALGAPAQSQAMANFQESPGQAYLRQQAEQALLRNQAAIGGLGGGRVRQELQRQAEGLASQDFQNAFARLGGLSQLGASAAANQGQLYGQQAGLQGQLYGQQASIQGQLEGQGMVNENARRLALAQMASQAGAGAADISYGTGQRVGADRLQTGRDIATSVGGTISALSNLANQGGADVAATIGAGAGNLSSVLNAAGTGQAASDTNLATLLQQILQAQGQQTAGLPGVPGVQQNLGILSNAGNFLQGAGALI